MNNKVMHKISYGLFLLTAKDENFQNGCIINTLMQISSNPLTVIVSVNKMNYTHDMIMKTKALNVSLLTEKTPMSIFKNFGFQSGKEVNKFDNFKEVEKSENGIYYLSSYANGYVSGNVLETFDFDTHTVFKVQVTNGEVLNEDESLTYSYYQNNIKPKPEEKKSGYRCNICGYVYEGEPLPSDFICPICKHGASDFTKI